MDIKAKITGIKYKKIIKDELKVLKMNEFDINEAPASCIVRNKSSQFAISRWVSPKRTRSYPYERVYNTLSINKKITVIPIVKDEGLDGDRDYLQWDTISLMSLLDVYVVLAYYNNADISIKRENKITKQKFDNRYVLKKIKEINNYHSSALHWNLKEVNINNFSNLIDRVNKSYKRIGKKLNIELSNFAGLDRFKADFSEDVKYFMEFSRKKASMAQAREFKTIQPKEFLKYSSKAKITIENFLGGIYFFTVDEVFTKNKVINLIESKHTDNAILPSRGDIKDGLLKMILYSNFSEVRLNNKKIKYRAVLNLTSKKIKGSVNSDSDIKKFDVFLNRNKFTATERGFLKNLIKEAKINNFLVRLSRCYEH